MNTSCGIVRVSEEEIVQELSNQHVSGARRITVYRDGIRREANTSVLTFNMAILPETLKIGYLNVGVDLIYLLPFSVTPVSSSDIMNEDAKGIVLIHCVDTVGKWETHMNRVVAKTQLNVPTAWVNM